MNTATSAPELTLAARRAGLDLEAAGDTLLIRGPAEVRQAWRERLREHKHTVLATLAAEVLPPEVEARIARLLAASGIDELDAALIRRRWHAYPDEWLFLIACCEAAAVQKGVR